MFRDILNRFETSFWDVTKGGHVQGRSRGHRDAVLRGGSDFDPLLSELFPE